MYGVLLILVLVITGGAIAFIGDRLGSKVGNKKLSLFGLRPRHTSIIVTIVTGILITTTTLGVMAAVSKDVRTALFGMERLNRTMQETRARLSETQDDLLSAQQQKVDADAALVDSQQEVERLESRQSELEAEQARLQQGNLLLEQAKAALMARNDDLAQTNTQLTGEKKALESQTEALRKGLISIREGDIVFRAGEVIASGVIRGSRPESEVRTDLTTLAQLASRNVTVRLGENKEEQDIWIYRPEFDAAVKTIAAAKQDMVVRVVASGNQIRGEEIRASLELYKNSVIYQPKEFIIARAYTLDGSQKGAAEQTLMSFLQEVNEAATMKGVLQDPIRGTVGVISADEF